MQFDIEGFVESCRKAVEANDSHLAVREIVAEAVSHPASIIKVVFFPDPDGPRSVRNSPCLIERLRFFTTRAAPS